jgi:hypothetical protein
MNKIPTAEEFIEQFKKREYSKNVAPNYVQNMIEFAQLHVEAALKAASEKATLTYKLKHKSGEEEPGFKYVATKNMILNAYPKERIK